MVSPINELRIIHGKKTIMVYRPDGEPVYKAGPAPGKSTQGFNFYIMGDALYFVKKNGRLEPLWVKLY